jgi:flagellar assembly protein FliH
LTPPKPKAGEGFPEDSAKGSGSPFIPAKHGKTSAGEVEPTLEEQLTLARQEGHTAGFEAGQKAAAESLAPVIQALQNAVTAMAGTESQMTAQAEKAVVELSLAISAKLVPQAIAELPDTVMTVVNQALSKVMTGTRLNLRVNPADLELLQARQEALALPSIDPARLTWSADPGVGRGGCILETDFGDIDARIEHQLQVIDKLFRQQLAKADTVEEGQGTA